MAHSGESDPTEEPAAPNRTRVMTVLVAVPAVLLAVLYALSVGLGTAFGNLVFVLTGVWAVAWGLATGSGGGSMRLAGTTRVGAFFGVDKAYAEAMSEGALAQYRDPGVRLATLTATVVLGWVVVLVQWLI